MSHHSRFLSLLALLATTMSYACSDASPTHPADEPTTAPATLALTPEVGAAFATVLEDARLRILPALPEAPAAEALRLALDDLSTALATRDRHALTRALERSDAALAALSGSDAEAVAVAPDLEAVRLILTEARPLLGQGEVPAVR